MLRLSESELIGRGMCRSCYRHPKREDLCVKVYRKKFRAKTHRKEVLEIGRLRKRTHQLVIPAYHGSVETNLGRGDVYDRILDQDGRSITFRDYLQEVCLEEAFITRDLLFNDLYQSAAVFADLNCGNILVLRGGNKMRFAIVDGLGEGTLIKVESLIPYLARRKLMKIWPEVEEEVRRLVEG